MTTAYPLRWPHGRPRAKSRRAAAFSKAGRKLTYLDAVRRLQDELSRIRAKNAVLSSNIKMRMDGSPILNETIADPGVVVFFQLNEKPVAMPCDTFYTVADNIAAIAAHIEASRAIERYGVATVAEMFSGFVALPAPKAWHEILGVKHTASTDEIAAAYRKEAAKRHPDRPGGSHDAMAELNDAREAGLRARA